ncbi:signal peptidase I [Patescibacteria group bacterium]
MKENKENFFIEILKFSLIAIFIVLPFRIFIAQPFIVNGSSMDDTFANGNYLIVDQISYKFKEPERGEVIVFRYPKDQTKFFIKRIIGLPEETVQIKDLKVTITNKKNPDGFELEEPYIKTLTQRNVTTTLGKGEYFVMGDNRNASSDSRIWGSLSEDLITGRTFLRLFPPQKISIFPGYYN